MNDLLNYVEVISGTDNRTTLDCHSNPKQYVWELAHLAFVRGSLSRMNLLTIGRELNLSTRKIKKDFEVSWSIKCQ